MTSPSEGPNPSGLCQCGCGQPTKIAKSTNVRDGCVKGKPMRFVKGHHGRLQNLTPPNPSGRCLCGCGQRTSIAPYTSRRMGWVQGHPVSYVLGHAPIPPARPRAPIGPVDYTVEDRGYQTPCWVWLHHVNRRGYGRLHGRLAHRAMYEQQVGPIPDDHELHHLCRVRLCVNADHLTVVTPAEHRRLHSVS